MVGGEGHSTVALYSRHGEIESLRLLSGRHCAFVNYSRASAAAKALKAVQVTVGVSCMMKHVQALTCVDTLCLSEYLPCN